MYLCIQMCFEIIIEVNLADAELFSVWGGDWLCWILRSPKGNDWNVKLENLAF